MSKEWSDVGAWEAGGALAERMKPILGAGVDAINELADAAKIMVSENRSLAVSSHQMAMAWDKVTAALRNELTLSQLRYGNQMTLARVETTIQSLDDIDWYRDFQTVASDASKNLDVLGKSLGSIVAVSELLAELKDTSVSAYDVGSTGVGALAGVLIGLAIATTAPWWIAAGWGIAASLAAKYVWQLHIAPALGIPSEGGELFWDALFDYILPVNVNSDFNAARSLVIRRDPLVLDLDGDGLELVGANKSILFDHNADGIKTATGWAGPDDGFLVRDLNANGSIDSGRELFGIDTLKANGQLATQGFDALLQLDANADGQITSADSAWNQLQIWRDANQDGISQAGELSSLAALNITRIGLNGSASGPQAGQTLNNNFVALSTTYTRASVNRTVGAIDLEANAFFSDIPTQLLEQNPEAQIAEAAVALPQMNGAGMVKDLRSAMSESGTQAAQLREAVAAFAMATTRGEQLGLIDALLKDWAQTSDHYKTLEGYLIGSVNLYPPAGMSVEHYRNMIGVLEAFNGARFYSPIGGAMPAGQTGQVMPDGAWSYSISPPQAQVDLLNQAYGALRDSVYQALVVQTRMRPYLDAIGLVIDEHGIRFDATPLHALLNQRYASEPQRAIEDLVELSRFLGAQLLTMGIDAAAPLRGWMEALPANDPLRNVLAQMDVLGAQAVQGSARSDTFMGNAADNQFSAGEGDDRLDGGAGADALYGNNGDDVLVGGAGNDSLYAAGYWSGGNLNARDVLDGGAGNDMLVGGRGSQTYRFGRGDGQDTINNDVDSWNGGGDNSQGKLDVLQFKAGVRPVDIALSRVGSNLIVTIKGSTDQVTLQNYFINDGIDPRGWALDAIRFHDGTCWSVAEVKVRLLQGSVGNDSIVGYATADTIDGGEGADVIDGAGGDDRLRGGSSNDQLTGGEGNDSLDGGEGVDTLYGGAGNDEIMGGDGNDQLYAAGYYGGGNTGAVDRLDGGAGNDQLVGGRGSQTYLFGRGDGQDTINNNVDSWNGGGDATVGKQDVLQFKAGVSPADVSLGRSGDHLIVKIKNSTDQVTVQSFFVGDGLHAWGWALDAIRFDDSTAWTLADIKAMALLGTAGNDTLTGYAVADVIDGGEGADTLYGRDGNDSIYGGLGNDTLHGENGNDTLDGSEGADVLYGNGGSDTLTGGAGNDQLYAAGHYGGGNVGAVDVLDGGAGNDMLVGGRGSQTYLFGRGDGQDTINNDVDSWNGGGDNSQGKLDVLQFKAGVQPADIALSRVGSNLIVMIKGSTDQVTVQNYFINDGIDPRGWAVDAIRFHDGTGWSVAEVKAWVLQGTAGNDNIIGYASADTIDGGDGLDRIDGAAGDDVINGGAGDDVLTGADGKDRLDGGAGVDVLYGGSGDDELTGGEGNDQLYAAGHYGGGNVGAVDVLDGGAGNDMLVGGRGSQTYLFGRGDGQDTINNDVDSWNGGGDSTADKLDVLRFKAGVSSTDVALGRSGDNLIVKLKDSSDQVTVQNFFIGDGLHARGWALDSIRFDDGTAWTLADIKAKVLLGAAGNDTLTGYATADVIDGGEGADMLYGRDGNDTVHGGAGNDTLRGEAGNDTLFGGADADQLQGGAGDDTLAGGSGNDTLIGGSYDAYWGTYSGAGNDTYLFGRGDGRDAVIENDTTIGNHDQVRFLADIAADQLWFRQVSNHLEVSLIGSDEAITINNWYAGEKHRVEAFALSDGRALVAAQVDLLVQAMASVAPPSAGQISLSADQQTVLAPVFAAVWK